MKTRIVICACVMTLLMIHVANAQTNTRPDTLRAMAGGYYDWRNENYPVFSSDQGLHTWDNKLTDYSPGAIAARRAHVVQLLAQVNRMRTVIHHYTREAGVRSLEREIASICRKSALKVVKEGKGQKLEIKAADIPAYLGVPRHRAGKKEEHDQVGLTHGLSVSEHGGDILDCEVSVVPGKGKLV